MPSPNLDPNYVDIEGIVKEFVAEQPPEAFVFMPESYSVVTGNVFKSKDAYFFVVDAWLNVGAYGEESFKGARLLASSAVARDVEIDSVVIHDDRVVSVSGFEDYTEKA